MTLASDALCSASVKMDVRTVSFVSGGVEQAMELSTLQHQQQQPSKQAGGAGVRAERVSYSYSTYYRGNSQGNHGFCFAQVFVQYIIYFFQCYYCVTMCSADHTNVRSNRLSPTICLMSYATEYLRYRKHKASTDSTRWTEPLCTFRR